MEGMLVVDSWINYTYEWGWELTYIFWFIPVIIGFVLIVCSVVNNGPGIIGASICTFGVVGCLVSCAYHVEVPHQQYQVVLEDNISMSFFANTYNIIEQRGLSYIIEEKEFTE